MRTFIIHLARAKTKNGYAMSKPLQTKAQNKVKKSKGKPKETPQQMQIHTFYWSRQNSSMVVLISHVLCMCVCVSFGFGVVVAVVAFCLFKFNYIFAFDAEMTFVFAI